MQRTGKKHLNALVILSLVAQLMHAQAKAGLENYNILRRGQSHVWMPVLNIESNGGLYAEMRYNYEELNTASIFAGKKIYTGESETLSFTPMLGLSFGDFRGASVAIKAEGEGAKIFFSSETQLSASFRYDQPGFLFHWSELGYNLSSNLFAGLSFQYTSQDRNREVLPGLMAGLSFQKFSIPVYLFTPFNSRRYFVIGFNYEYTIH